MRIIILLLVIILSSVNCWSQTESAEKNEQVHIVMGVLNSLIKLAEKNVEDQMRLGEKESNKAYDQRIENLQIMVKREIDKLSSPEELVLAARMSYAVLYRQDAEDIAYDRAFDMAFWECVNRLANDTSNEAVYGLRLIKRSGLVQGDISAINEAIQGQQKRLGAKQKPKRKVK